MERWEKFRQRYRDELDANAGAWEPIIDAARRGTVTLLYSAHDPLHNGAVVLRDVPRDCVVAGNPARVIRRGVNAGRFGRLPEADETQLRILSELAEINRRSSSG